MSDDDKVIELKLNRKDRRIVKAIQERVKRQNNKLLEKYVDRISELSDKTKVDFSLYNMIMERVDFRECKNSLETLHKFYSASWGYFAKLIRENYNLRMLMAKYCFDSEGNILLNISDVDREAMEEMFATDGDPLMVCREALEEVRKAARKRADLKMNKGIILPDSPKLIT